MTPGHQAAVAALYAPTVAELILQLPEIGDRLQAQLHELQRLPTAERAERMAIELGGAQRYVLQVREALIREGGANGR